MAIGVIFNKSTGGAPTGLGSFTSITQFQSGSSPEVTVAYLATAATTAVTFSGTITSDNWTDIVVTLLPASGGATSVTGVVATAALAAPAGSVAAGASVSGVAAPLALAAPVGTPFVGRAVAGVTATAALAAPAGSVSAGATLSGVTAPVSLSAPPGLPSAPMPNAGNVVNVWESWASGSYTYAKVGPGSQFTTLLLTPDNSFLAGGTGVPTAGNWLFAVSSWQSSEDQAVMYASDDQHNFWQPLGISGTGKVRIATMCVQNARAPSFVCFSSSAFVRDATYTVVEVSGLNAGFILDSVATNTTASGTSVATSQTIAQADFVLSASVFNSVTGVINTTTGSTTIPPISNALIQTAAVWKNTSATPFAETFSSSTSTSAAWGAVSVAVVAGAPLPVNMNNNAWPVIQLQAAFGASPGDTSAYYTWTDISSRFLGVKGRRGRQFELDQLEASDVSLTLDNSDGALNPLNTASPFWPNVKLMTPVRMIMTWQGQMHQVFNGHFEYLPQTYEFQHGIVDAECADAYSKLPQVLLQNCIEDEILYDKPFYYWPLGDQQGLPSASNWSGRTTVGLNVINSRYGARTNQFGATPPTPLIGDDSPPTSSGGQQTVWTQSGVTPTGGLGTCLQVIDPNFPPLANGVTVEQWISLGTGAWQGGLLFSIEDLAKPGIPQGIAGNVIALMVNDPGGVVTNNGIILNWVDSAGNAHQVIPRAADLALNTWYHIALQVTSTTYKVFLNGVSIASGSWGSLWSATPNLLSVMGQQDKFNQVAGSAIITPYPNLSYAFINGSAAHLAVFDRIIDPERLVFHYNAGVTGFAGETTGPRVSRLLAYARWGQAQTIDQGLANFQALNYLGTGYASATIGGSAGNFGNAGVIGTTGAQTDLTLVDTVASENGLVYMDQNGALVFRQRSSVYNGPIRGSFGDVWVPLNKNVNFEGTISPWTGQHGATAVLNSATWSFSQSASLRLTPDGVTANPAAFSEQTMPVTAGSSYVASAWVYSPPGWGNTQIEVNWFTSGGAYISTTAGPLVNLPPSTPLNMVLPCTAVPTAAFAQLVLQLTGTPAATVVLYIDRASFSVSGSQVPYLGDISIDYDITNLYNLVTITRNWDGTQATIVNQASLNSYFPRTYMRTIFTQPQNPPTDLVDCANWLLAGYAQPALRIASMKVDALTNPDAWQLVLTLDVGDIVSVQRTPPGQPAISQNFIIVSITPNITPDEAIFDYVLAPVLVPVLTLNDPIAGQLGPNSLGF
jgi:hypothetical protein